MIYLDTQILSYAFASNGSLPADGVVLSVAAKEFLQVYTDSRTKDRYYFPAVAAEHYLYSIRAGGGAAEVRPAKAPNPHGKRFADRMIVDFRRDAPPVIEFSSRGVAAAIARYEPALFDFLTGHIEKGLRKNLRRRYDFICESQVPCQPLATEDVESAFALLDRFLLRNNPKANFRNTWNDMVILSRGMRDGVPVLTRDRLLAELAAEVWKAKVKSQGAHALVEFGAPVAVGSTERRESKGFVNRGWMVFEKRQRGLRY